MFPMLLMIATIGQNDSVSPPVPVDVRQVRESVEKSLPFLAKKGVEWETTRCVSCHHGPWMMWSGYEARKRGFTVDDKALEKVRAGTTGLQHASHVAADQPRRAQRSKHQ